MNEGLNNIGLKGFEDSFVSFKGCEFNINDQKWILDINKKVVETYF